jgi:FkbM family methyltransferase
MKNWSKRNIRKLFHLFGLEIYRTHGPVHTFDHTFRRLGLLHELGFSPAAICDVGASDGRWSRRCLEVFQRARYFCVEPLDEHQVQLARLSAEHPNVSYWQGCLGPQAGTVILNVDGDGSSILPGHFGNLYGIQREVPVETLDNLVLKGTCPQPELIKLDVQGYELEILKGAPSALTETQAIIAEISFFPFQSGMPVFHEVVRQLAEHGFVVHDILSLSLRPLDRAAGQIDVLFLSAGHPLRSSHQWDRNSLY